MSMKFRHPGNTVSRAFAVLGAAIAVSAAVERRQRPMSRDLDMLGINPKAFDRFL